MAATSRRTALVTGANRGLGLEVCRRLAGEGLAVVLTARDAAAGAAAAAGLAGEGLAVRFERMDVGDPASIAACVARLAGAGVHVDVLVANAAIYPPGDALRTSPEVLDETLRINLAGAFHCARAFLPAMLRAGYGRVVNVSSGSGSFAEGLEGPAAYAISKAALNALTVILAREAAGQGDVKVNAACPGWVRTRMGGPAADRSVEEGADTLVWLATLPADGPTGGFFRDRRRIEW